MKFVQMYDSKKGLVNLCPKWSVYWSLKQRLNKGSRRFHNHGEGPYQGHYDGRGQPTASPMLTAIMSGGVGISGRELYKYR